MVDPKKREKPKKKKTSKKKVSKGGRPTNYKEEYNEQAMKLCLLGFTDKQLSEFFEVSEVTLNAWKKKRPQFLKSLRAGKEFADAQVSASLYERALGYSCKDTKFASFEGRITDEKEYTKHYPPDTQAALIWLKNRQPEMWREKQEIELSVTPETKAEKLLDAISSAK